MVVSEALVKNVLAIETPASLVRPTESSVLCHNRYWGGKSGSVRVPKFGPEDITDAHEIHLVGRVNPAVSGMSRPMERRRRYCGLNCNCRSIKNNFLFPACVEVRKTFLYAENPRNAIDIVGRA